MTGPATMPTGPVRRIAFLGTPDAAATVLDEIAAAGIDVVAVVTRPDTRRGRGSTTSPSPVKNLARRHGMFVTERVDDLLDLDFDLGVVVAYGALVKPHVLARHPMVNLHFSLLPRWRGAAPVERAILAGDRTTGVCLMQLEEGLDTGGVFARVETPIEDDVTAAELRDALVAEGTRLLLDALRTGFGPAVPQSGEVTYASKLTPDDVRIDWKEPAERVLRRIRVGNAWTTFSGRRLKIRAGRVADHSSDEEVGTCLVDRDRVVVITADLAVELLSVQPEGKSAMDARAWANGVRPHRTVLGR